MTESGVQAVQERIGGELLAAEGLDTVFGIVDGTYLGFYAAFEKHGIRLVSPRHETCAAHMAGAYARSTGRLGVCMASNGPGIANILPGVAAPMTKWSGSVHAAERLPELARQAFRESWSGRPAVVHVDVEPAARLWAPGLLEFKEMHGEPVG